jgi:hypothetical protein
VVTHKRDLRNHIRAGEFAIVVPKLAVHEPIAWGDIPGCVGRAEHELAQWIEANSNTNDPAKREAITAWRARKLEYHKRSLDLEAICFT